MGIYMVSNFDFFQRCINSTT